MGFAHNSAIGNGGIRGNGSSDRRRSCRYQVLFPGALLGWREGSGLIELPARFIDLSLHGCMLELERTPDRAEQQPVLVRAVAASSEDWVEGVVLSIRKPLFKRCRIRIAFRDSFSYESFKKLVYGKEELLDSQPGEIPEHEQNHYWK
jgi:hypothetical protein